MREKNLNQVEKYTNINISSTDSALTTSPRWSQQLFYEDERMKASLHTRAQTSLLAPVSLLVVPLLQHTCLMERSLHAKLAVTFTIMIADDG